MISSHDLHPALRARSPSSTLSINEEVNRRRLRGQSVHQLGFGESRFAVHPRLRAALENNATRKSYLPARGLPTLCESVAAWYTDKLGIPVAEHQVIVGPGSKSLIFALQMALDADLFLPAPAWVSYAPQAELLGRAVTYIPARPEDNYRFDLEEFRCALAASGAKRRLLLVNSPNNPTGQMYDVAFLRELADVCRAHDIRVLSDEIYSGICHGDTEHRSLAEFYPEGTFVLGGLSKHLSLGGWRLGVAVVPDTAYGRSTMSALETIASEIWSAVASPVQFAAIEAYSGDEEIENYVEQCGRIHGIRTRYLRDRLEEIGVRCTNPQGGFYVTANFDFLGEELAVRDIRTSAELAKTLLESYAIATLAADSFGLPREMLSLRLASGYLDMEDDDDSARLLELEASGISEQEFMSKAHHPNTNAAIEGFADFVASLKS